jgi:hypothetical protein
MVSPAILRLYIKALHKTTLREETKHTVHLVTMVVPGLDSGGDLVDNENVSWWAEMATCRGVEVAHSRRGVAVAYSRRRVKVETARIESWQYKANILTESQAKKGFKKIFKLFP